MRTINFQSLFGLSAVVCALCAPATVLGQDAASGSSADDAGSWTLGGFAGFTDRYDADFTFGGELEYRTENPWSASAIVEHTPDAFADESATLLLGAANYRPVGTPRLELTGGAGVEFKEFAGGDDFRFRAGAGYDLIVEGALTVTPRIAVDFGEGNDNTVLGATANYRF